MRRLLDYRWVRLGFRTFLTFDTGKASCQGILTLVPGEEDGERKIWVMRTVLKGWKGVRDVDILETVTRAPDGTLTNGDAEDGYVSNGRVQNGVVENGVNGHEDKYHF